MYDNNMSKTCQCSHLVENSSNEDVVHERHLVSNIEYIYILNHCFSIIQSNLLYKLVIIIINIILVIYKTPLSKCTSSGRPGETLMMIS